MGEKNLWTSIRSRDIVTEAAECPSNWDVSVESRELMTDRREEHTAIPLS